MKTIEIREKEATDSGFTAEVILEGKEYPVIIDYPCTQEDEKLLEWYFEKYGQQPESDPALYQKAEELVVKYGRRLFTQVFSQNLSLSTKFHAIRSYPEGYQIEIFGKSKSNFHELHWETLYDDVLDIPLGMRMSIVRRNIKAHPMEVVPETSSELNILLVTARPHGPEDVGYRTISRPLIECLQQANLQVNVEILRPSTYSDLVRRLEDNKQSKTRKQISIIHFDLHGSVMEYKDFEKFEKPLIIEKKRKATTYATPFSRSPLNGYEGKKSFLFFESDVGLADPVESAQITGLLRQNNIPIVILNACQSAKLAGEAQQSLAADLMGAGIQLVLAMGFSVTVSAAKLMMPELYSQLFKNGDLVRAITRSRQALSMNKYREVFLRTIELEDWMLPVVYLNREVQLHLREMSMTELLKRASRPQYRAPDHPIYGFCGRDTDLLKMERRLICQNNILLIQGEQGVGKTALLHHVGEWWQKTGWIDEVFHFSCGENMPNLQSMIKVFTDRLIPEEKDRRQVSEAPIHVQANLLSEVLRAQPNLLIIDGLDSLSLSNEGQKALHDFIKLLKYGKTKVIFGSRNSENRLSKGTFELNKQNLTGLDREAISSLAHLMIERNGWKHHLKDKYLKDLVECLAGSSLPFEEKLSQLAYKTPLEILLEIGDE